MNYPVSVIIPAHNAGQTIKRAIDSAFTAGADEVIVVNDGSTDGTGIYANALAGTYPAGKCKVLHTSEGYQPAGVCHARNLGIQRARHDLILPLDADDYLLLDGIRALMSASNGSTAVYGNHIDNSAEKPKVVHAPPPIRLAQKNLTGATYLFNRKDWETAGGYHPDFNLGCEDWAFMAALVSAGVQLVRVESPIYVYSSGGKRAARCMRYADAIRQLLREHYPTVFETGFRDAQQSR